MKTGFGWCQDGVGTSAECDNMAEPGKRYCSQHRARNLLRHITAIPPGVFILEELAARGWTTETLRNELTHELGSYSDAGLLAFLDGSQTVKPICPILARLFGTSVTLWNNIAYQWDKRAENGQQTVNPSLTVPHRSSE